MVLGDSVGTATVTTQGLHRRLRHDAKGGDFQLATSGDHYLATSGDFFMATDKTQCTNQIRALLVNGPADLREQMKQLPKAKMVRALARLRPGADLADPSAGCKHALRSLARRYSELNEEIKDLHRALAQLTQRAAPELLERPGVGVQVAAQLLVTAGDNPGRLGSEASFAHLTGVAPIPASSGQRHRHRLNRGGDRAANNALYTVVLSRMRHDEMTRAYVQRRTAEGLSKKDIIRCLKRAVAREMHRLLTMPYVPNPVVAEPPLHAD